MKREASPERLQKPVCPGCLRMVFMEPAAKQGDVIHCPGCHEMLMIARVGEHLKLNRWREVSLRRS